MKKFLISILLFITIFFVSDLMIYSLLKANRPIDYKLLIESKKVFFNSENSSDIIFIGDSHIADATDVRIVENITQSTSFNLGLYHSSPIESFYLFKNIIESKDKNPKILAIGTNPKMFTFRTSPGKYTLLVMDNLFLKLDLLKETSKGGFRVFSKSIMEKYLFSTLFKNLMGTNNYKPTREIHKVHNGYLETHNQIPSTKWNKFSKINYLPQNEVQIYYFEKTIELALDNGIEVIIVNPPIWQQWKEEYIKSAIYLEFLETIDKISKKYNLPVYNYSKNDLIQSDFLNIEHLNYFGAQKFSSDLAQWIKVQVPTPIK